METCLIKKGERLLITNLCVNGEKVEILDVCGDFVTGMFKVKFRLPIDDPTLEEWRIR